VEWVSKLDIGPVYDDNVKRHRESKLEARERELVFDIDMDMYDDVRTCCKEAKVCKHCFQFLTAAVKVLDRTLREDFGFEHIVFIFSGRRGIHCWVSDERARTLTNKGREAVASYLSLQAAKTDAHGKVAEKVLRHPIFTRAYEMLKDDFPKLFERQKIFNNTQQRKKMVDTHFSEPVAVIRGFKKLDDSDDVDSWEDLCAGKHTDRVGLKRAVLHYLYPRLDVEVSKQTNHLLKAPFCVHPKTGKVCVPLDVSRIDEFNPDTVPTLDQLIGELQAVGAAKLQGLSRDEKFRLTSLKPYVEYFDRFVKTFLRTERTRRGEANGELF
jgi:DNA primase small subunit